MRMGSRTADLGSAALTGAVGGAIGGAGGAILGKAVTAVGAKLAGPITKLLGRGIQDGEEEAAQVAGRAATGGTEEGGGSSSCPFGQSFAPSTRVLLASGKAIPIAALKAGDKVTAADATTGRKHTRAVAAVMVNRDTDLFDVTVGHHGRTATLHTTSGHPFWSSTRKQWVRADQLTTTDRLTTTNNDPVTIDHTQATPGAADRWDLTIDVDHDFYVYAGADAVLVHNCSGKYSRSSGYRAGVRDAVWEDARETATGQIRDPLTGRFMSKDVPWDMGHLPGEEFRVHAADAAERGISREEFLDEHNDPSRYRPELPSSNRSHRGEVIG